MPYIVGLYVTRNDVPSEVCGLRVPFNGEAVISWSDPLTKWAVKGTENLMYKNAQYLEVAIIGEHVLILAKLARIKSAKMHSKLEI